MLAIIPALFARYDLTEPFDDPRSLVCPLLLGPAERVVDRDQLRICREQATRDGWQVVAVYKDAAISGSSVTLRPGIQALLQDAQARKFERGAGGGVRPRVARSG
ncbi:MAG TPA: recombinase family protein [Acetobacteraceae bacterium]|nr:recombinase family protein [Acetobacteraceae bacterium]